MKKQDGAQFVALKHLKNIKKKRKRGKGRGRGRESKGKGKKTTTGPVMYTNCTVHNFRSAAKIFIGQESPPCATQ